MVQEKFGKQVCSGDKIRLKSHSGAHIGVDSENVKLYSSNDKRSNITIEKNNGGGIMHNDQVFFKASTDKHMDVEDTTVRARWCDHGGWQSFVVVKESGQGNLMLGDVVFFKAHTGNHLDAGDGKVMARYNDRGDMQKFIVDSSYSEQQTAQSKTIQEKKKEPEKGSPALRRRQRRVYDSDEDDDFFTAPAAQPVVPVPEPPKGPFPGDTLGDMLEDIRKKLQAQLIEGMFKYAEKKYGRKKKPSQDEATVSTKEDYALYLNSLKVRVKQADTRLQVVLKQLKDVQSKADVAQKEFDVRNGTLLEAEKEKENAEKEGREPILPSTFIVPQRSKKAGATLGSLVMKASKKDWGAALDQFAARRRGGEKQPEWAVKRNKASSILGAGKNARKSDSDEVTPATVEAAAS